MFHKKKYSIKARLRKPNFANYLSYYHENNSEKDYFYQIIKKTTNQLLITSKAELTQLKIPTNEGFYFKNEKTVYFDKNNKICLAETICDQDVTIDLVVTPYDFTTEDKIRRIGISIAATKIKAIDEN